MSNKLKSALIGGLIAGVLSSIPIVNYCCCIWGIGGGAVAGLMYIKGSPIRVRTGDGAIVGALAGVVGALLYLIIGLPIAFLFGAAAIEEQLTRSGVKLPVYGALFLVVGGILAAICIIILTTIGGLLAVPIFEKRKDSMPPPPPGGVGGGYAA